MIIDWDQFVKDEEKKSFEARQKMQGLIDEIGIPIEKLQELGELDLNAIDPEFLQEIKLSLGVDIRDLPREKPRATASSYRQRGRSIAV